MAGRLPIARDAKINFESVRRREASDGKSIHKTVASHYDLHTPPRARRLRQTANRERRVSEP